MSWALTIAALLTCATPPTWTEATRGVEYTRLLSGDGQAFRVDLKQVALRVAKPADSARVGAMARGTSAVIAINGGYFDPQFRSLGLLISDGAVKNPLRKADWGVITVDKRGRARLVHTRDYKPSRTTNFAIQAGPRLVVKGRPLKLKPQRGRRTALGITRDGRHIVIFIADRRLLLPKLARVMRDMLDCPNALNLDGGSSTQLWSSLPGIKNVGGAHVANGVLVVPKE